MVISSKLVPVMAAAAILVGCSEDAPVAQSPTRSVKTWTVSEIAGDNLRQYSGRLIAADTADLGFSVGGRIADIAVDTGDAVKKGQVLARLDEEPFRLDEEAARAELEKARSALSEKQEDLKRKQQLFDKGWVSKAALEQSRSAAQTANGQVTFARSKLDRARRSLADTRILAPFDGTVRERLMDPFVDIGSGQKVLVLDGEASLDIVIAVPEQNVGNLAPGMPALVNVAATNDAAMPARVTRIATTAGAGSVFDVTLSLDAVPSSLRAGMTAQVQLADEHHESGKAHLVPLIAIVPGSDEQSGSVFVYDADSSTVRRRDIVALRVGRGNFVGVEGVSLNEKIVIAGVSFLSDGQKVTLLETNQGR